MNTSAECRVAILTPPGRGAVASIGVHGQAGVLLLDRFFRASSGRTAIHLPLTRIAFGTWQRGPTAEEVVVCRLDPEHCEIHCHGGRAAAAAIIADLVSVGAVEVDWRAWVQHQADDLLQAEAAWALAEAPTARCSDILVDQHEGALRQAAENIQTLIRMNDAEGALRLAQDVLAFRHLGQHLTRPFRVALLGPPNVGKSSLANQLLGYQRSIVFDQPGTTRDVVSAVTAFDGWPVELLDTAGVRATSDPLEAAGTQRAASTAQMADLILLVHDPLTLTAGDATLPLPSSVNVLRILNKVDLLAGHEPASDYDVGTSAITGSGIAELARRVAERLVPQPPAMGQAVPFTERQTMLLDELMEAVQRQEWERSVSLVDRLIGRTT